MKHPLFTMALLIPLLWLNPLTNTAAAAGPSDDESIRLLLARGYSLDDAVSKARRRYPGKVLSAETIEQGGRPVYRIRIMDEGRVRGLRYDGNTGQPLSRGRVKGDGRGQSAPPGRYRR